MGLAQRAFDGLIITGSGGYCVESRLQNTDSKVSKGLVRKSWNDGGSVQDDIKEHGEKHLDHVPVHEKRQQLTSRILSYDCPPCFLRKCLPLNLQLSILAWLARQWASTTPTSSAGVTGTHHHTQFVVWELGIQTQVLTLIESSPHSQSQSSSPKNSGCMLKEGLAKLPDILDVELRLMWTSQRKELPSTPTEKTTEGASFEGKDVKLAFRHLKDYLSCLLS